jgi:hypothetical protein
LIAKSKEDGQKLYKAVDSLNKIFTLFLSLLIILGIIAGILMINAVNIVAGLVVMVATIAVSFIFYLTQMVVANSAKVLVHILFSNIAKIKEVEK